MKTMLHYGGRRFVCGVLLFAFVSITTAQKREACEVSGIKFRCPKGFQILGKELDEHLLFLFDKKDELGLFVVAPATDADLQKYGRGLLTAIAQKTVPKENQAFKWKPLGEMSKVSKYEVQSDGVQGYNGNLRLVINSCYAAGTGGFHLTAKHAALTHFFAELPQPLKPDILELRSARSDKPAHFPEQSSLSSRKAKFPLRNMSY